MLDDRRSAYGGTVWLVGRLSSKRGERRMPPNNQPTPSWLAQRRPLPPAAPDLGPACSCPLQRLAWA